MILRIALLALALPAVAHAQGVEIMRGGKIEMQTADPKDEAAEPECKTLSTGDTFCKVDENGVSRWVLQGQMQPDYAVGDVFPVYKHSMLMDLRRYSLPPVTGPWRYYVLRGVIYKVGADSHKVIEVLGPAIGR